MKHVFSIVLSLVLLLTIFACSFAAGDAALDGTWPAEKIKIGVVTFDTADAQFLTLQGYFDYLTKFYNIEFVYSEAVTSAEQEMAFIDSCGISGCNAIIGFYNVSGVEAVREAQNYDMYYALAMQDTMIGAEEFDNYLGGFTLNKAGTDGGQNGDYAVGYEMGYTLGKSGRKHVLYSNGAASMGWQTFIDRQEGFVAGIAAAQAEGSDIQFDEATDLIEGWPGTDSYTAAQAAALDKDYDAIAVSHSGAAVWFQPIASAGKSEEITIACLGSVDYTYKDAFENGLVSCLIYDCEEVVYGTYVALIINACVGDVDITRNDGAPASIYTERWNITDSESYNKILETHSSGNYFITAEDLSTCFTDFNPEASYEYLENFYGQYTLDYALNHE